MDTSKPIMPLRHNKDQSQLSQNGFGLTQELLSQVRFDHDKDALLQQPLGLQAHGASLDLTLRHLSTTAQQLLCAERISLGWNEICTLLADGHQLGCDELLLDHITEALALQHQPGPPGRQQPRQVVAVAVTHEGNLQVHLAQPGCFLFEILADMDLPLIRKVVTSRIQILPVDLRIWHPMTLVTLSEFSWNQPHGFFRVANGPSTTTHPGLHDGHIWQCLQAVLSVGHNDGMQTLAIHPALVPALLHGWIS